LLSDEHGVTHGVAMAEDPPTADDAREREHAHRNRLQKESLRREFRRALHRAYIEAALARFRQEPSATKDSSTESGAGNPEDETTG
jgi:hypothetical protein